MTAPLAADRLFRLLPALYRERDLENGSALEALLRVIEAQADLIGADIRQLYDNTFIETCEPWVVPYLGDLVGTLPIFDASDVEAPQTAQRLFPDLRGPLVAAEVATRRRADVAKTISYRRRKGTLPMLEELARDMTGWSAHAVEFFTLLGWSQCVRNHVRLGHVQAPDLRNLDRLDRLDSAFDEIAHTVDVRPIGALEGWHNLRNLGLFLGRLRSYEVEKAAARRPSGLPAWAFTFSQLGISAPLFTRRRREADPSGLASELDMPLPIRPTAFYFDPGAFYGPFDKSLLVVRDGVPVPLEQVRCSDLRVFKQPTQAVVAIDPRLGRMAFGAGFEPSNAVEVFYHRGFSADLGGGSYARRPFTLDPHTVELVLQVEQSGSTPGALTSLNAALLAWQGAQKPNCLIRILDNATYAGNFALELADGKSLTIEAADGVWPHLQPSAPWTVAGVHPGAGLTLSGLLVEGRIVVTGELAKLRLLHTTLVPGGQVLDVAGPNGLPLPAPASALPSLEVTAGSVADPLNEKLEVEIAFAICGALRLPRHALGLTVIDSIVEGVIDPAQQKRISAIAGPGGTSAPPSRLERVTIFGPTFFEELREASEVIFSEALVCERRQRGCVRFSYLPSGSKTPRRYRCLPDLAIKKALEEAEQKLGQPLTFFQKVLLRARVSARLKPAFSAQRYGLPGYGQLHLESPSELKEGAADGAEIGAFCHLKQKQRLKNLELRLAEYLPFGLEHGEIFVT